MDLVTADEVRGTTFGTARFRSGYDMADVDEFLSRVERTIADLTRNLAESRDSQTVLRAQCDQLRTRLHAEQPTDTQALAGADESLVLTSEIRNRVRRMLTEQLALLDD